MVWVTLIGPKMGTVSHCHYRSVEATTSDSFFNLFTPLNKNAMFSRSLLRMPCACFVELLNGNAPRSLQALTLNLVRPKNESLLAKHTTKCNCSIESICFNVDTKIRCSLWNNNHQSCKQRPTLLKYRLLQTTR